MSCNDDGKRKKEGKKKEDRGEMKTSFISIVLHFELYDTKRAFRTVRRVLFFGSFGVLCFIRVIIRNLGEKKPPSNWRKQQFSSFGVDQRVKCFVSGFFFVCLFFLRMLLISCDF